MTIHIDRVRLVAGGAFDMGVHLLPAVNSLKFVPQCASMLKLFLLQMISTIITYMVSLLQNEVS